jgi:uncharacterized repeat protein (TIGR03803 family)
MTASQNWFQNKASRTYQFCRRPNGDDERGSGGLPLPTDEIAKINICALISTITSFCLMLRIPIAAALTSMQEGEYDIAASSSGLIASRFYVARLRRAVSAQRRWLKATLVLWLLAPSFVSAVTFTNLHSFLVKSLGSRPFAPVALGSDGNLYGTTSADGTNGGQGAVFKVTTNGVATLLHTFTGGADGGDAESALVQWTDGSFYGTTRGGGVYSNGTVFKITTNGALTTLVQFTGGNDGSVPVGGLVPCPDGNFMGQP